VAHLLRYETVINGGYASQMVFAAASRTANAERQVRRWVVVSVITSRSSPG
jgi:hypothetical protein